MAKKDELNFETDNKMASSEKLKALQAAMEKIEKSFGKGSIMKMGDDSVEQVEVIPTGSIALNVGIKRFHDLFLHDASCWRCYHESSSKTAKPSPTIGKPIRFRRVEVPLSGLFGRFIQDWAFLEKSDKKQTIGRV